MKAEVTQGVGCGTSNIQPGMEKGEFDLYSEYTGTGWNMVMKKTECIARTCLKTCRKNIKRNCLESSLTRMLRESGCRGHFYQWREYPE